MTCEAVHPLTVRLLDFYLDDVNVGVVVKPVAIGPFALDLGATPIADAIAASFTTEVVESALVGTRAMPFDFAYTNGLFSGIGKASIAHRSVNEPIPVEPTIARHFVQSRLDSRYCGLIGFSLLDRCILRI